MSNRVLLINFTKETDLKDRFYGNKDIEITELQVENYVHWQPKFDLESYRHVIFYYRGAKNMLFIRGHIDLSGVKHLPIISAVNCRLQGIKGYEEHAFESANEAYDLYEYDQSAEDVVFVHNGQEFLVKQASDDLKKQLKTEGYPALERFEYDIIDSSDHSLYQTKRETKSKILIRNANRNIIELSDDKRYSTEVAEETHYNEIHGNAMENSQIARANAKHNIFYGGKGCDDQQALEKSNHNMFFGRDGSDRQEATDQAFNNKFDGSNETDSQSTYKQAVGNQFYGGYGDDYQEAFGFSQGNKFYGGQDNDYQYARGQSTKNFFYGDKGNDNIYAMEKSHANEFHGGDDNDTFIATDMSYSNHLYGEGGIDVLVAEYKAKDNRFYGGEQADNLIARGAASKNAFFGGGDNDVLIAMNQASANIFQGNWGTDILIAEDEASHNEFYGGHDADIFISRSSQMNDFYGDEGSDVFVIEDLDKDQDIAMCIKDFDNNDALAFESKETLYSFADHLIFDQSEFRLKGVRLSISSFVNNDPHAMKIKFYNGKIHIDEEWLSAIFTTKQNSVNLKLFNSNFRVKDLMASKNHKALKDLEMKLPAVQVKDQEIPNINFITKKTIKNLHVFNAKELLRGDVDKIHGFIVFGTRKGMHVIAKDALFTAGGLRQYTDKLQKSETLYMAVMEKTGQAIYNVSPFSKITLTIEKY